MSARVNEYNLLALGEVRVPKAEHSQSLSRATGTLHAAARLDAVVARLG